MSTQAEGTSRPSHGDDADVAFAGVAGLAGMIRARELSPREAVEVYLARIARLDPRLNAFKAVFAERALAEADAAERRVLARDSAPLLGVPLAIKDQCDIAGDVTAYGTAAFDQPAAADSEVVRRLRVAGAIPIGKTNMCELGLWPFSEGASWGITRNPWNPDRTAGGSSGGSAAAVAAGMAAGAIGGDGGGSIRTPAGCCGVVGIKPQRGRVSLAPLGELWYGLVVVGPIARSVLDAALLLDVIADSTGSSKHPFSDAARHSPARLRVCYSLRPPPGTHGVADASVRGALSETVDVLRGLGHSVRQHDPHLPYATTLDFFARYLRGTHDELPQVAYPDRLERRTRAMARLGGLFPRWVMRRLGEHTASLSSRIDQVFDEADVLLMPTFTTPAVEAGRWQGRGALQTLRGSARWTPYSAVWNVTGHPSIAIPAGFAADGLPLSVQLVGRPGDEATSIALAAELERERRWTQFRPTVS